VNIPPEQLTRQALNKEFVAKFGAKVWQGQPQLKQGEVKSRLDFLKERIGVEVSFTHASFLGIDVLKFQTAPYANFDLIDVGVYIVVTSDSKIKMSTGYHLKWKDALSYERVVSYLPTFRSAIQVPIFVVGLGD
jgi:hypothetical protein